MKKKPGCLKQGRLKLNFVGKEGKKTSKIGTTSEYERPAEEGNGFYLLRI